MELSAAEPEGRAERRGRKNEEEDGNRLIGKWIRDRTSQLAAKIRIPSVLNEIFNRAAERTDVEDTRNNDVFLPPPPHTPPGVSARPGGPLLGSEWEDVPEADSVAFEKPLKATREHGMQNKRACHRPKTARVYFPGNTRTIFPSLRPRQKKLRSRDGAG